MFKISHLLIALVLATSVIASSASFFLTMLYHSELRIEEQRIRLLLIGKHIELIQQKLAFCAYYFEHKNELPGGAPARKVEQYCKEE